MGNATRPNTLTRRATAEQTTPQALILDALTRRGSVLGAAQDLNVTPNTVRYWLTKMGMKATTRYAVTLEREVSHE